MKINFKRVEVFSDVAHTQCSVNDIQKQVADMIYNVGTGIEAHALALKVFNADESTEYDMRECALIREFANRVCSPNIIDAITKITEFSQTE